MDPAPPQSEEATEEATDAPAEINQQPAKTAEPLDEAHVTKEGSPHIKATKSNQPEEVQVHEVDSDLPCL